MTREQMATTIVRAFNLKSVPNQKSSINVSNVSAIHKNGVQTLAQLGITKEKKDFKPKVIVTRGEFMIFLYRTMQLKGLNNFKVNTENVIVPTSNREHFNSTMIFHESQYIYANRVTDMIIKHSNLTMEEAKQAAALAVAFPNTPIQKKQSIVYHIPQEENITFIQRNENKYAPRLVTYNYSNPEDVPLPSGKTLEEIKAFQEEKAKRLRKQNNLSHYHSISVLNRQGGDRNRSMSTMVGTLLPITYSMQAPYHISSNI